ncbi:MAG TPA: NUDIX hydrolase [Candidatus Bathyarchaeia archaeon]|nr:NUDIX hydrolase [Candidatus Bathyarchaeia archaeon]
MKLPISIKGIVFENGRVWLRKNERDDWELPGGKLDEGEQPEQTVIREVKEELGFIARVVGIIQANVYVIKTSVDESWNVLVISYLCEILEKIDGFELEGEAGKAEFRKFTLKEVKKLNMPDFYKEAILKASLQK